MLTILHWQATAREAHRCARRAEPRASGLLHARPSRLEATSLQGESGRREEVVSRRHLVILTSHAFAECSVEAGDFARCRALDRLIGPRLVYA